VPGRRKDVVAEFKVRARAKQYYVIKLVISQHHLLIMQGRPPAIWANSLKCRLTSRARRMRPDTGASTWTIHPASNHKYDREAAIYSNSYLLSRPLTHSSSITLHIAIGYTVTYMSLLYFYNRLDTLLTRAALPQIESCSQPSA